MTQPIAINGIGQTRFGEWWGKSLVQLAEEAMDAALDDAGIPATDVDMIVVANMIGETVSGQAHLGSLLSSLLPHRPPALRVESACGSGAFAVHTACAFLESGRASTVLVIGAEKMTDASTEDVASALMGAADGEKDRPSGLTFPGIFGLIASRYMHEFGLTREDLNLVSAVHHRNAVENPFAQFRSIIQPEAIGKSTLVADPLRLLDCSPISDGAAALVLSKTRESDIHLRASSISTDAVSIADRATVVSFPATRDAWTQALREAEIHQGNIDVLELHDCFSIAPIISLEDMGYAQQGEGIELYRQAWAGQKMSTVINQSGGLKACGHPVAATGIKQIGDVAKQLRTRQARFGAAQNFGGACGSCAIHILENIDAVSP